MEVAARAFREATSTSPTLSPAQLALLTHSLPADERYWLIEGLCAALRDANEKLHDSALHPIRLAATSVEGEEELARLHARVAVLQSEVAALRGYALEHEAARSFPSLSTASRRQLIASLPIETSPSAPPTLPAAPYLPSGMFSPWRGVPPSVPNASPTPAYHLIDPNLTEDSSAGSVRAAQLPAPSLPPPSPQPSRPAASSSRRPKGQIQSRGGVSMTCRVPAAASTTSTSRPALHATTACSHPRARLAAEGIGSLSGERLGVAPQTEPVDVGAARPRGATPSACAGPAAGAPPPSREKPSGGGDGSGGGRGTCWLDEALSSSPSAAALVCTCAGAAGAVSARRGPAATAAPRTCVHTASDRVRQHLSRPFLTPHHIAADADDAGRIPPVSRLKTHVLEPLCGHSACGGQKSVAAAAARKRGGAAGGRGGGDGGGGGLLASASAPSLKAPPAPPPVSGQLNEWRLMGHGSGTCVPLSSQSRTGAPVPVHKMQLTLACGNGGLRSQW